LRVRGAVEQVRNPHSEIQVRLAFAVAAHRSAEPSGFRPQVEASRRSLEPKVLLVTRACPKRKRRVLALGRRNLPAELPGEDGEYGSGRWTVLFVSRNMGDVG
jgi:hypothetical protein